MDELAVGVMDIGEAPLPIGNLGIQHEQVAWLTDKNTSHLVYVFHHYGKGAQLAIDAAATFSLLWDVPVLMTEFGDCDAKFAAANAGFGWSFWEYSCYCDTAPSRACTNGTSRGDPAAFGTNCSFGACITGTNGNAMANYSCPNSSSPHALGSNAAPRSPRR